MDKNGIHCFNSYTLKPSCKPIKREGSKITSLVLADLDRSFAVSYSHGKIERFTLPDFKPVAPTMDEETPSLHEKREKFHIKSIDFVLDGVRDQVLAGIVPANTDPMYPVGVVGTDGKKRKFKVVDKNNRIVKGQKYAHGPGDLT